MHMSDIMHAILTCISTISVCSCDFASCKPPRPFPLLARAKKPAAGRGSLRTRSDLACCGHDGGKMPARFRGEPEAVCLASPAAPVVITDCSAGRRVHNATTSFRNSRDSSQHVCGCRPARSGTGSHKGEAWLLRLRLAAQWHGFQLARGLAACGAGEACGAHDLR